MTDESESEGDARIRAVRHMLDSDLDDDSKISMLRKLLQDEGEDTANAEGEGEGESGAEGLGPSYTQRKPKGQTRMPPKAKTQGGAQTSPSEINFNGSNDIAAGRVPQFNAAAHARFVEAMKTEFMPKLKASFNA